jgi:carbamoylphosphate synthase large subunit
MTYTQKKNSGEKLAPSIACETVEACVEAAKVIGYPVIVRSAFALGGLGSGFAHDQAELVSLVQVSYIYIYIHTHTHTYYDTYVCIPYYDPYVCMYTHTHTCMYVYTHTHTHTHTHMYVCAGVVVVLAAGVGGEVYQGMERG